MQAANRRHLYDLPLDKLDSVVLGEDAGFGHAMVLRDVETVSVYLGAQHVRFRFLGSVCVPGFYPTGGLQHLADG